jgi:TP901 family phage tail tape measure protein
MAGLTQSLKLIIGAENNASAPLRKLDSDARQTFSDSGGIAKGTAMGMAMGTVMLEAGKKVVQALTSPVTVAAEFESAMSKAKAVTQATGEDFTKLKDLAKEMGSSTAFSASQAAEGITFLGQAGFSTDEIFQALPSTLNLAAAGGLELAEAADIASNVLSGMRLEASETARVTDVLAQASASSNTNVQQLGNAFAMVAPGAAAAGVSLEDTAAALGVLADNGIQASSGGTALNAALRTMLKPSKDAEEAAKRLGLEFFDASGNIKPLNQIVGDLEEANISAKDALVIFGEEGGRAINALVGSGSARFDELKGKIEDSDGAAANMAATMKDNFNGALTELGSAFEGVQIALGESLLPMLSTAVSEYITPAVQATGAWITEMGGLKQMFEDAVVFVGGALQTIWNIIDGVFSDSSFREKFLGAMGGMFSAAIELYTNFTSNFRTLVSAAGGFLWAPLKFAFSLIWDEIKEIGIAAFNGLITTIQTPLNAMIDGINAVGETFGLTINNIDFTPITADAPRTIEERWRETEDEMKARLNEMSAASHKMGSDIGRDATRLSTNIGITWATTEGRVDGRVKGIVSKYKEGTLKIISDSAETGTKVGKGLVENAINEIENQDQAIAASGQRFGLGTLSGFNEKLKAADGIGGVLVGGLTDVLNGGSIKQALTSMGSKIGSMIGGPLGAVVGAGLGKVVGSVGSLFGGKGRADKRLSALENLQGAIAQGDISKFSASGDLLDTLETQSSTQKTLDSFSSSLGINAEDTSALIQILTGRGEAATKGGETSRLNKLLGADANRAKAATAMGLFSATHQAIDRTTVTDAGAEITDEAEAVIRAGDAGSSIADRGAAGYLRSAFLDQRISRGRVRELGAAAVSAAVELIGGPFLSMRSGLLDIANGGTPDLMPFQLQGIDIVAGAGGRFVASKPTTVMFGEQGAEEMTVRRLDGQGYQGSGGGNNHFTFNVNALDPRSFAQWLEREGKQVIINMLRSESQRGREMIFNSGLIAAPTV